MELEALRPYIQRTVEVLVGGVWLEGYMTPIVKGLVVLLPLKDAESFYGPAAVKAENILAIRELKNKSVSIPSNTVANTGVNVDPGANVRSALDQVTPSQRFKIG